MTTPFHPTTPPGFPEPDDETGLALARVIVGTCHPADERRVQEWVAEDPAHAALFREYQAAYDVARMPVRDRDADAAWARMMPTLRTPVAQEQTLPLPSLTRRRPVPSAWRRFGAYASTAAAVGVVMMFGLQAWNEDRLSGQPHVWEYQTARGQRSMLELPDGSQVILAPATRLQYRADGHGSRHVELEGQAYFTVVPNPSHTFTVSAAGIETAVLGTSFVVRAYPEDTATHIVVSEGRVSVADIQTKRAVPTVLSAGNAVNAKPGQPLRPFQDITVANALGWTNGWLVFEKTSLRDALPELARQYNAEFSLETPDVGDRHMTLTLTSESLDEAAHTIATVLDMSFTRTGNRIVFRHR